MKNSSTLRETSFLLNADVQRGQCWSLRGRAPMETCPECCWKTGAFWVPATQLTRKISLRLSFRPQSLRPGSSSCYLPAISRAGRQHGQVCCWKSGVVGPWESPCCISLVGQALGEHLAITPLLFPVHEKAQVYPHHPVHWKHTLRKVF